MARKALMPDVGEVEGLKRLVNKSVPDDLKLHLYTNEKAPAEDDTVASYTECTAEGYSAKTLTGASWTVATTEGVSEASYAEQTFSLTAAATIKGYYITNADSSILIVAERFTDVGGDNIDFVIPSGGGDVKVTPKITLD